MPMLLPPKVDGPVSILSNVVHVSGAVAGATVQLQRNGDAIGTPDVANYLGRATIAVAGLGLQPNDKLTATQQNSRETSEPSQHHEVVMGAPTKLPPPIFLSQLQGCSDCVIIGGAIVGAVLRVKHNDTELGFAHAEGTEVTVLLTRFSPLPAGAVLLAWQEVTVGGVTHRSAETPSLPLPALDREQLLTPPMVVPPMYECDPNVLVTGIHDGASMEITTSEGQGNQFFYYGASVRFGMRPLKVGEEVTARQYFRACQIQSTPSVPVKAVARTHLPSPRILPVVCPGAKQIVITDLVAGALISVYANRNGAASMLGEATANGTTQTFNLPPSLPVFPDGPAQTLSVFQSRCNVGSQTTHQPIESLTSVPRAPTLPAMVECGRVVEVAGLVAGVTLQLTSDQADWPVLCAPLQAIGSRMTVFLSRALRADENVTATVTGCGAGAAATTTQTVLSMSALSSPKVAEPVRLWMSKVTVIDCVPGAQVHVYVNDIWRGRAEATSSVVEVFVGKLNREDRVSALQCLCTKITPRSTPLVNVTLGKMRIKLEPDTVIRNAAAQSVTVHADDADDGHKVPAKVRIAASTFSANTPFNWIFPSGSAPPAVGVSADDYSSENVTWPLADPSPVVTAPLSLQLLADAPAVINQVNWTVYKQEVPPTAPSLVASVGGSSASVSLPKPAAGQIVYYVCCSVSFDYLGTSYTANFVRHAVSPYSGAAMIGWSGAPLTGKFALTGEVAYNEEGQPELVFWIYFWGVV